MKNLKSLLFLLILCLIFLPSFMYNAIPASERASLIAFYNSTNGDNWTKNDGWKTPPLHTDGFAKPGKEGSWYGVYIEDDHVVEFDLDNNQLSGSIPSQIGNLSKLHVLSLCKNNLTGIIPSQLGNLSKINILYLSENQLSGQIPPQLGNLNYLQYLQLNDNQLNGTIPSQLGNLSSYLRELLLYSNQLSGNIPFQLGNLRELNLLRLENNKLNGSIPSQLGSLTKLTTLWLNLNQLSGSIPSELGNLSNLYSLLLDNNQLSGSIPPQLGNLSKLSYLHLYNNQLSGVIPVQIGNLNKLIWLYLNNNKLSGEIPSSFTNLTALTDLNIGYNCLSATDPTLIAWLDIHDPDWEAHQNQCNPIPAGDPFGSFDTPVNGSTVYSSIPVTGWALDDSGVDSVKIYRKDGKNMVYIGDGVFVEGARPDVAAAYPEYPNNTKAGWGYMLLTNFLPNGGNGTYILESIATDVEGNQVSLGTKTIYVDNFHAVKPFGAIDTPGQGGTATGSSFINWGWVLTPKPDYIPTNGSTINVWVDGVNLGHPNYNLYRNDIATLFPGYANSSGAAGYFYLDTTAYANGVHIIQWTATDNAGDTDGIGSRYFTIQNASNSGQQSLVNSDFSLKNKLQSIPVDYTVPIRTKKGYGQNLLIENTPDENGMITIEINELERVEIQLTEPDNSTVFSGCLMVGDQLCTLPIGSTLYKEKGIFYWQTGPGFFGDYRLVFVAKGQNGELSRKEFMVRINPKFY